MSYYIITIEYLVALKTSMINLSLMFIVFYYFKVKGYNDGKR